MQIEQIVNTVLSRLKDGFKDASNHHCSIEVRCTSYSKAKICVYLSVDLDPLREEVKRISVTVHTLKGVFSIVDNFVLGLKKGEKIDLSDEKAVSN
jgi:hypothetical protein